MLTTDDIIWIVRRIVDFFTNSGAGRIACVSITDTGVVNAPPLNNLLALRISIDSVGPIELRLPPANSMVGRIIYVRASSSAVGSTVKSNSGSFVPAFESSDTNIIIPNEQYIVSFSSVGTEFIIA